MIVFDLSLFDQPFDESEIEFRPGNVRQDDKAQEGFTALALAYISSRAVMDRLDRVVGKENWRDEYTPAPAGGVMCTLYIRIDDEWIGKSDVGENTDFEAIKGGFSDALKRAAVKWGIGRYLYNLPPIYHPVRERDNKGKKTYSFIGMPKLPNAAKAPSRLDDRRETRLNTNEQLAKPKGTHIQVDRPFVDVNEIVQWLQLTAANVNTKIADNQIDAGKSANIARSVGEHLSEKVRHYLLWIAFNVESSKDLKEREWTALKMWLGTTAATLDSECALITDDYATMEMESPK